MATIELAVNGRPRTVDADPQASLLTVLRENLDLTGTKYGCGEGQCGACTVLIDGRAQSSCVTRAEDRRPKKKSSLLKALLAAKSCIPCSRHFSKQVPCSADTALPE